MKLSAMRKIFLAALFAGVLLTPMHGLRAQLAPGHYAAAATQSPESAEREVDENDAYRHSAMVKKVGSMMGLNAEQAGMALEVFNFAILAIFVGWLLARMLPKAFRNRSGVIQQQLVDARSATEEAGARLKGVEARLAKLDDQIAAMRAQAEKDSELDEQRIKASVEDEKKKILASAEQEIAAATSMARRQLQQYAADLAISQAAQKLVVTAETDRLLVQAFAQRLAGEGSKDGQN
ncbi:MAG TPA: ATP synthase F0 subunit B [Granulicella sp.]|nr:ATP synthase F0 subunit B [Granulicella sp.]